MGFAQPVTFLCANHGFRCPHPVNLSPVDIADHIPVALSSLFDAFSFATHLADATTASLPVPSPAAELGDHVVGDAMMDNIEALTVEMEEMSLSAVGHDLLLFLAASVVVDPLGKILGVTPVLLYLILGFVAGPYGLSLFTSGTEVNSEIGDFGILFLLFVEGLNLSPERLKALGNFFSLGATQLLLSVGLIFFGLFFGG
jgi:hypothetical protein